MVLAGNWGRIVRLEAANGQTTWLTLIKEQTIELIRMREFPDAPSRFLALFMFAAQAELTNYLVQKPFDVGYEVELVDPSVPVHRTDMAAYESISPTDSLTLMEPKARAYWSTATPVKPELLTTSAVRILRCC